jgi:hypothetical protein
MEPGRRDVLVAEERPRFIGGCPADLHDENQSVARVYGAVWTRDFFGYDASRRLKYRGRPDEGRTGAPPAGARRELVEAMRAIATGMAPPDQMPSVGGSIEWKAAASATMPSPSSPAGISPCPASREPGRGTGVARASRWTTVPLPR